MFVMLMGIAIRCSSTALSCGCRRICVPPTIAMATLLLPKIFPIIPTCPACMFRVATKRMSPRMVCSTIGKRHKKCVHRVGGCPLWKIGGNLCYIFPMMRIIAVVESRNSWRKVWLPLFCNGVILKGMMRQSAPRVFIPKTTMLQDFVRILLAFVLLDITLSRMAVTIQFYIMIVGIFPPLFGLLPKRTIHALASV